ncbi:hypothetical protein [Stutzerimonas tarimensis]|uniref:Cytochrome c domain-containing protein n=1 Tax=Stutzerimonas tarimensis TaxID=1507735 RepID=A0ABV7T891_9GAMM
MSRRSLWAAPLALLLAGPPGAAAAGGEVSFSRAVVPVLRTQCAGCHMTGDEPGGMKLYPSAAYASLVGVPSADSPLLRVAPGEPEQSYLMHKLEGTHLDVGGQGAQMPFAQLPLAEETRAVIRQWIEAGAPDN